jgi:hypothetical protein
MGSAFYSLASGLDSSLKSSILSLENGEYRGFPDTEVLCREEHLHRLMEDYKAIIQSQVAFRS